MAKLSQSSVETHYTSFDDSGFTMPSLIGTTMLSGENVRVKDFLEKCFGDDKWIARGLNSTGRWNCQTLPACSRAAKDYWTVGMIAGSDEEVDAVKRAPKQVFNPTFLFSTSWDRNFTPHGNIDPIASFHTAEVFDLDLKDHFKSGNRKVDQSRLAAAIAKVAMNQFKSWCQAYSRNLSNTVLRLHCGDALALCHRLQKHAWLNGPKNEQEYFVRPWSASLFCLDGHEAFRYDFENASIAFDVIDTSNAVELVGMVNFLVATAPLLKKTSTAVLYTESHLAASQKGRKGFAETLTCDPSFVFLIIGLAPTGYVLGYSTDSIGSANHPMPMPSTSQADKAGFRTILSWKMPNLADSFTVPIPCSGNACSSIHVTPDQVADCLYGVYEKMFDDERFETIMTAITLDESVGVAYPPPCNTPAGFAALVRLSKKVVETKWDEACGILLGKIQADKRDESVRRFHDLSMHLQLMKVWGNGMLSSQPRDVVVGTPSWPPQSLGYTTTTYRPTRDRSDDTGILARRDLPSTLWVTLIVPRCSLDLFKDAREKHRSDKITPSMHMCIAQRQIDDNEAYESSFFSFQGFFGK